MLLRASLKSCVLLPLIVFIMTGLAGLAHADVKLNVSERSDSSRLVFTELSNTPPVIKKSGNILEIEFPFQSEIDLSSLTGQSASNIRSLEATGRDPLTLKIQIPEGADTRELKLTGRLVIDIFSPSGGKQLINFDNIKQTKQESAAPSQKPEQSKSDEPKSEETSATPEPSIDELIAVKATQVRREELNQNLSGPTLITLSSTKSFGAAVFDHAGYLWLVTDTANNFIQPQVSGPLAEYLGEFEQYDLKDGMAFRAQTPENINVNIDGSGLVWRITLTNDTDVKDIVRAREEGYDPEELRSGRVIVPLNNIREIVDITDPQTGQTLKVVTVQNSDQKVFSPLEYPDFRVLQSHAGLTIKPRVDTLTVEQTEDGIVITTEDGLLLTAPEDVQAAIDEAKLAPAEPVKRKKPPLGNQIFYFDQWDLGELQDLEENKNVVLFNARDKSKNAQVEDLITLAKAYLADGYGPEALGFLRFAVTEVPELSQSPEYIALRGLAETLRYNTKEGFQLLSDEKLKKFDDVHYWRTYALAELEDWGQAIQTIPDNLDGIYDYPAQLQIRLGLALAEVALRAGNINVARELLELLNDVVQVMNPSQKAAYDYLEGEASRQLNDIAKTKEFWTPLTQGDDDLYRARAGLALTRLLINENDIEFNEAIDRLERLRYAWRGDSLEVQINYWLGRTYFEAGEYATGLNLMKRAVSLASTPSEAERIAKDMSESFLNLFLTRELIKVSPLDAVALYERYSELVPLDSRGDQLIESLAEHLVNTDLLGRAADLFSNLVERRLKGEEQVRVGMRLAVVRLLDGKTKEALEILDATEKRIPELPDTFPKEERLKELQLLKARILSKDGQPDQALALLNRMDATEEINRLRSDIAWNAQYWDDAAQALQDVIIDKNFSLARPLKPDDANIVLNRAIALNLAGNRVGLANMRERYSEAMSKTDKARLFEVITRPRQSAVLADRDTLTSVVSEIDLFADFLDTYKNTELPITTTN